MVVSKGKPSSCIRAAASCPGICVTLCKACAASGSKLCKLWKDACRQPCMNSMLGPECRFQMRSGHAVAMVVVQITACMADQACDSSDSLAKGVSSMSCIGLDLYVPAPVTTYVADSSRTQIIPQKHFVTNLL